MGFGIEKLVFARDEGLAIRYVKKLYTVLTKLFLKSYIIGVG